MSWSFSAFIIPSTLKRFSVTVSEMHPQTVTEPPRVSQMAVDSHCWTSLIVASTYLPQFQPKMSNFGFTTPSDLSFSPVLVWIGRQPSPRFPFLKFLDRHLWTETISDESSGNSKGSDASFLYKLFNGFFLFLKDLTFTPCPLLPFVLSFAYLVSSDSPCRDMQTFSVRRSLGITVLVYNMW